MKESINTYPEKIEGVFSLLLPPHDECVSLMINVPELLWFVHYGNCRPDLSALAGFTGRMH